MAVIFATATYVYSTDSGETGTNILGFVIVATLCLYPIMGMIERRQRYRQILKNNPDCIPSERRARKFVGIGCALIVLSLISEMVAVRVLSQAFIVGPSGAAVIFGGALVSAGIGFALTIYGFLTRHRILWKASRHRKQ
jgi:hypothetical protein